MKLEASIRLDLRGLRGIKRQIASGGGREFDVMFHKWSVRYLEFARRRFVKYSRGGGNWPSLAPSTIRRRRKGGKKRGGVNRGSAAILVNTGTLLAALQPGAPGTAKRIPQGVQVGYTSHEAEKKRTAHGILPSNATIAQIASYHQAGGGHLPQRRLIVRPDESTVKGMKRDAAAALREILHRHSLPRSK